MELVTKNTFPCPQSDEQAHTHSISCLSGFLNLPAELRNLIYEYITSNHSWEILRTSKRIRSEVSSICSSTLSFVVHVGQPDDFCATPPLGTATAAIQNLTLAITMDDYINTCPQSRDLFGPQILEYFGGAGMIRDCCAVDLWGLNENHCGIRDTRARDWIQALRTFTGFKVLTVHVAVYDCDVFCCAEEDDDYFVDMKKMVEAILMDVAEILEPALGPSRIEGGDYPELVFEPYKFLFEG